MERIYLDNAATTPADPRVLAAAEDFTAMLSDPTLSTSDVTRAQRNSLEEARREAAGFLNCSADEIALMQSTSHAFGTLINSLPFERGDNVLICDLEYQASTVCWHPMAEKAGIELREVKTRGGRVTAEDFRRRMDGHTRAILLAAVQEINGFRADVKEICALAREHGCYSIVDGIQEAGALRVDVRDAGMDFYCAGGKKWIGNPFGTGFLYIRGELLKSLKPPYYSYFDILVPGQYHDYLTYLEDPRRHPFDDYTLARNASVFEAGGYGNYIGAMGLRRAIRVLNETGMDEIERKNLRLARKLYDGLSALGMRLSSPGDEAHMSSIVTFSLNGLKDNNVEAERALVRALEQRGIFVSLRCSTGTGGIRVSARHTTPEEHVDRFLEVMAELV